MGVTVEIGKGVLGFDNWFLAFDIEDSVVTAEDANGVVIANTYDALHRLRTRTYPDGGVEKFGYSARGMIAYTNQLGFTNFFVYDEAGRKTFETNANWELVPTPCL